MNPYPKRPSLLSQGPSDFIKLNAGQVGLYRVSYSEPLWERLISAAHLDKGIDGNSLPALSDADLAGMCPLTLLLASHIDSDLYTSVSR